MEEDILYEVHILRPNTVGRETDYTFIDLSTGQSYRKCLPDYIKQKPVAELNAHTRFVRDVNNGKDGKYQFDISWDDGEMFVNFKKSAYQQQQEYFDSLTGILW